MGTQPGRVKKTMGRSFALLVAAVLALASPIGAQAAVRILLLETMPVPVVLAHSKWFKAQLGDMGYAPGRNMALEVLEAKGDRGTAEALLKTALAKGRPDLVVTNATMASQTAVHILRGTGIPILFMTVSDPVGAGIIQAIGVPTGTNITGRVHTINRRTRIDMVMRLIGGTNREKPVRIGFIHSTYPSAMGDIRELRAEAGNRRDIAFVPFQVAYRKVPAGVPAMLKDVSAGIDALNERIDAWWEPSGPLGELGAFTRLILEKSKKPIAMGTKIRSVQLGALLHLTPSIEGSGRETARLADAILKGADPGKIPPVPPAAFDLGINLKKALELNIVVPPDLLKLAGPNVFH
jgi:putative tryptophan/tyrosine transport system substrate-binding protein